MAELSIPHSGTNGRAYAPGTTAPALGDDLTTDFDREFSLKSFKCFARQHPLLLGFGAAGIGATMATVGAGYVLYRGAVNSLPARMFRAAKAARAMSF